MPVAEETEANALRQDVWDAALHLYGTAAIFEARAKDLKTRLNWLKVTGIVLPVLVGASAATFGVGWSMLGPVLAITGVVGIVQLVMSSVSLALKWDDGYAEAKESQLHNSRLADQYKKIAERFTDELQQKLVVLDVEKSFRDQLDQKADITKTEKQFGMRVALNQFQRACVACKVIPDLNAVSSCSTCGK